MIKSRLFLVGLTLCFCFATAVNLAAQTSSDPYLTKNFTLNGPGELEVETSGSSVAVTGRSGNEVLVEMYVKHNGKEISSSTAEVEDLLDNYVIDISQSGNTITLKVKGKSGLNWKEMNKLNLSFKLQVPEKMSTDFESSGGSISLTGVAGDQNVKTSGGSIRIADSSGKISTRSSGGSFSLSQFTGEVDVQTSGGAVNISGMSGVLAIGTSGGSVNLEDISGGIDAQTSGGSIRANLSEVDEAISFRSSGGSISLAVPAQLGLNLDLRGGRVNTKLSNFDGEVKRDLIVGELNGGGHLLSMQSSGGSINLEFVN